MDVAYIYTWKRDAPMRFFFRVRTNEPSVEDELPEVPLRRSPSISGLKSINSLSAPPSDSETVNSDDSTPFSIFSATTDFSSETIPTPLAPQPSEPFMKPESPATPSNTTPANPPQNTQLQKLKLTLYTSTTPPTSPRSSADAKSSSKSPKVKTPKSIDEKLAKIAARVAKKSSSKESKDEVPEKRVENIKLKIEQNSVTIVKSTTKELKMRFKKDREQKEINAKAAASLASSVPTTSSSSTVNHYKSKGESSPRSKKSDIASIKLAKVTERSDSTNGQVKYEIKSPVISTPQTESPPTQSPPTQSTQPDIKIEVDFIKSEVEDSEEKKSEFLNSFQLTPTKSLSPEKLQQIDAQIRLNQLSPKMYEELKQAKSVSEQPKSPSSKRNASSPPILITKPGSPKSESTPKIKEALKVSTPVNKSIANEQPIKTQTAQKRKNKDPVKNVPKKSRSNSPEEPINSTPVLNLPEISLKRIDSQIDQPQPQITNTPSITKTKIESNDQQLMRPPIEPIKPVKDVFVKPHPVTNTELTWNERKNLSVKPIDKLMPKPLIVNNVQRPTQSDTPHPTAATTKRPSSTKKLAAIAPKPTSSSIMPPPLAPPLHIRNNSESEIKQIKSDSKTKDLKIYAPHIDKHPLAIKAPGSSSPAYVPSYPSLPKNGNSSGYLNYALLNSHKRASETPLGSRTPAYSSSPSPSYSPSSPQFSPSYNISPYPQYKYMKPPSHLANFFPNPPKPIPVNNCSPPISKPQPEELNKRHVNENALKRSHNTSPKNDKVSSPPEKQQKVQSLLDSCKITFPSSLSITLHEQKDPKSNQSMFQAMHKSPVNNYIEIVKLPDLPASEESKKCGSPTKKPLSPTTNSKSPIPIQPRPLPSQSSNQMIVASSSPMQYPMAPPPIQSHKSHMTMDKKIMPELQLIDRMTAIKTSFQEKFIKSLDDPKAPKGSPNRQPKTANSKSATTSDIKSTKSATAPIIARRHSMAPNAKETSRAPIRIAPKQETIKKAPRSPSSTSPRPMPHTFSSPNLHRPLKSDDALDLTSGNTSASPTSRSSPINHNNNDHHHKKHSTEMLPPPPPPPTSSAQKPSAEMAAAIFAAAMARASQTTATFMTPQNLAAAHLQQHLQQQYLLDHLTRMQKVGQEHFAEALANYSKAAAVAADAKAAAAVADQGKMPPPKTSTSPKASSSTSSS